MAVRQLQRTQLTVVLARGIGVGGHEHRQVLPLPRHEHGGVGVVRFLFSRPADRQEVGRLLRVLLAAASHRVVGDGPHVGFLQPGVAAAGVVAAEDLALDLELVLRVAQMLEEIRGDLLLGRDHAGEHLRPGLQDGIFLVPFVQRDGAVVGVHGGLDRVAQVVDLLAHRELLRVRRARIGDRRLPVGAPGIGVAVRRGVAVDDPHDLAVHDAGVGVGVQGQPGSHLLHPVHRQALEQQLRFFVDPIRKHQVDVAQPQREQRPDEEVADRDAALAGVGVARFGAALTARRGIEFDGLGSFRRAGHHPVIAALAEVDPRLVLAQQAHRRDAAGGEDRLAVALALIAEGRHHAVAVGVDGALVVPQFAGFDGGQVELAHGHHHVEAAPVDLVAVDVEGLREAVVAAHLLQLLEGTGDDRGIHQANGGQGLRVGPQLAGADRRDGLVVLDLDVVDAVGLLRRRQVGRDEAALALRLVGLHLEALDEPGVHHGEDDPGDHQQRDRQAGHAPTHLVGVVEAHQRAQQRHRGQDGLRGDPGGRIGVGHTGEQLVGGDRIQVAGQEGGDREEGQPQAQQDRHVALRRHGALSGGIAQPAQGQGGQRPGHEMHGQRGDPAQHQGEQHETDQELHGRQDENEEGDIHLEMGIRGTEPGALPPGQEDLARRRRGTAAQRADDHGRHRHQESRLAIQHVAQLHQEVGVEVGPAHLRAQPVGDQHVGEHDRAQQQPETDEQHDLGHPLRGEDRLHREVLEPEIFGDELRDEQQQSDQDADDGYRH